MKQFVFLLFVMVFCSPSSIFAVNQPAPIALIFGERAKTAHILQNSY